MLATPFDAVDGVVIELGDALGGKVLVDVTNRMAPEMIDAGPLVMARALEAMAILNIPLNTANQWPWQTGWKLHGPTD